MTTSPDVEVVSPESPAPATAPSEYHCENVREADLSLEECPDNSLNSSSTIEFGDADAHLDIDEESNVVPPPPPELPHGHEDESQVSYKN